MSMPNFMKKALEKRSQSDLARELGLTRQTVSSWARGVSKVRAENCEDFERVTGVPREEVRPDIFKKQECKAND